MGRRSISTSKKTKSRIYISDEEDEPISVRRGKRIKYADPDPDWSTHKKKSKSNYELDLPPITTKSKKGQPLVESHDWDPPQKRSRGRSKSNKEVVAAVAAWNGGPAKRGRRDSSRKGNSLMAVVSQHLNGDDFDEPECILPDVENLNPFLIRIRQISDGVIEPNEHTKPEPDLPAFERSFSQFVAFSNDDDPDLNDDDSESGEFELNQYALSDRRREPSSEEAIESLLNETLDSIVEDLKTGADIARDVVDQLLDSIAGAMTSSGKGDAFDLLMRPKKRKRRNEDIFDDD